MISIRRRLIVIFLGLFALAWLLLAALTYISARHQVEALFDAELAQAARVLYGLTLHELDEEDLDIFDPEIIGSREGHKYNEKIAFQVWKRGALLMRSTNAPETPMTPDIGHHDRTIDGRRWRIFALTDPERAVGIEVGELYEVREKLIYAMLLEMLFPMLLTLPLLAVLISVGVNRGLRPLHRIAGEIALRSPRHLHPLTADSAPVEVRPLVRSLNALLTRLHEAFDSERRFTAFAAHELRTPLGGLKAQAQLALRASDDADRRRALGQIVRGVDRATHLVEQLLTLARLDPDVAARSLEPVDIARQIATVVGDLAPLAQEKDVRIEIQAPAGLAMPGHAPAVAIMLRNLLDNAIRHSPSGQRVVVEAAPAGGELRVAITDSGPGIAPEEREQVFNRFYRVPGTAGEGCGLGLSIVRRVVELHQGRIHFDAPPAGTGLVVRLSFPVAQS